MDWDTEINIVQQSKKQTEVSFIRIGNDGIYVDSQTGKQFLVDSRSGNSFFVAGKSVNGRAGSAFEDQDEDRKGIAQKMPRNASTTRVSLRQNDDDRLRPVPLSAWAEDELRKWKNPVFSTTSTPSIMSTNSKSSSLFGGVGDVQLLLKSLSKTDILKFNMINQADSKFIAVWLDTSSSCSTSTHSQPSSQLIIMIDQHAADERVKLEALIEDLFSPSLSSSHLPSSTLHVITKITYFENSKLKVSLSQNEIKALMKFKPLFAAWGMAFTAPTSAKSATEYVHNVVVESLPSLISDRCATDSRLLSNTVKLMLAWFSERAASGAATCNSNRAAIPDPILDILKSKACRSAIMFGDKLSEVQCRELLMKVSGCQFPFQCGKFERYYQL